ncbi:MAG: hypothetical protein JXQ30_16540 [Spirochaetes bacterium]|nr:hypothetical protein [Spirochaetota bacterium]
MHWRGGHFFAPFIFSNWGWGLIVIVGLVLLTVILTLILRSRRTKKAQIKGLNSTQRRILEDFEAQVLALLFQHGGQLNQLGIVVALGLPAELVAEKLLSMEAEGLIERQWTVEEYTYSVKRKNNV